MLAAAGNVSTHATRMFRATPQRTADSRFVAPTPMIAEVIVCVVEIGQPSWEATKSTVLAVVSAAKPSGGRTAMARPPWARVGLQAHDEVPGASMSAGR